MSGTEPSDGQQKPDKPWRYRKGQSGNPAGRPKGSRNAVTVLVERIMADDAKAVTDAVVLAAKGGDMQAAKIIVDRLAPLRKGAPTPFDLPDISGVTGVGQALDAVLRAVARGELTPEEAGALGGLLEARRRTWESEEVERRLTAIEQRQGAGS